MNRYRTAPGLGPTKATTATKCQKCLQKGHYSYECKSELQSRPYVSRASRTQQMRNPKLKPALSEVKFEGANNDKGLAKELSHQESQGSLDELKPQADDGAERPTKRQRRSPSVSSIASVSTISTTASITDREIQAKKRSRSPIRSRETRNDTVERPSRSAPRQTEKHVRAEDPQPRHRRRSTSEEDVKQHSRSPRGDDSQAKNYSQRQSQSRQDHHSASHTAPRRQRSLSPYSRRIALTQSMNGRN